MLHTISNIQVLKLELESIIKEKKSLDKKRNKFANKINLYDIKGIKNHKYIDACLQLKNLDYLSHKLLNTQIKLESQL